MTVNYVINKTDGTLFGVVAQGSSLVQSGLTLIGKNYVSFGEALNEDLVHITECFANTVAPSNPLTGQLWFDKGTNILKYYSGSKFTGIVTGAFQSSTPIAPVNNDLWFDTGANKLYIYQSGSFRLIGPNNSDPLTQVISDTIKDTTNVYHTVLRVLVNKANVAIISNDTFTPAISQLGFATTALIQPGINLGTDPLRNYKFVGIATTALSLSDGVNILSATNIVRSNASGSINGSLNATLGFTTGTSGNAKFVSTITNDLNIINSNGNANIALQTTDGSSTKTTLFIQGSNQRVGINNATPGYPLDVTGDTHVSGNLYVDGAMLSSAFNSPSVAFYASDNTTKVATTAWVQNQFIEPVLKPTGPSATARAFTLSGFPTTPHPSSTTSNTEDLSVSDNQIVTTKWVQDRIGIIPAGLQGITIQQSGTVVGNPANVVTMNFTGPNVSITGAGSNVSVDIASPGGIPSGMIAMWYGLLATIPTGWAMCDGTLGTPDLRDLFVVGAGHTYIVGQTGGASGTATTSSAGVHDHSGATGNTTLTVDQMPTHTHKSRSVGFSNVSAGHSASNTVRIDTFTTEITDWNDNTGGSLGHNHTIASDGAHTHNVNVVPPYYALYYIMKL